MMTLEQRAEAADMRILYFGDDSPHSTSFHRAAALMRLGHEVSFESPMRALSTWFKGRWLPALHHHTGYRLLHRGMHRWIRSLMSRVAPAPPDLIWINGGETFDRKSVEMLRTLGRPVLLYTNDDPTGGRDGHRFDTLLTAVKAYDLIVLVREPSVAEVLERGARDAILVWRSYDEVEHLPFDNIEDIPAQFRSDVAFVGTCLPGENRDQFLVDLIDRGIDVAIWGNNWQEARLWPRLRPYFRGRGVVGRDYVAAVQGAKISLGLLSKGNRDLHTTRSLEIPYIGGLLLAQRTPEHIRLFDEGTEAVFWDDTAECAAQCKRLLADEAKMASIRLAGQLRVKREKVGNEDICRQILQRVRSSP